MRRRGIVTRACHVVLLSALLGACAYFGGQEITVLSHRGTVQVRCDSPNWSPLGEQTRLKLDCDFSTEPTSALALQLKDRTVVELNPSTRLHAVSPPIWKKGPPVQLEVQQGEISVAAATPILDVRTPTAAIGIRGTVFAVRYDPQAQNTTVAVIKGHVQVTPVNTALAPVELHDGQQVEVTPSNISPVTSTLATGTWQTEWGEMTLSGGNGNYPLQNGRIYGQLNGNKLVGYWTQTASAVQCASAMYGTNYWGRIDFTFDTTGNFIGPWSYCDGELQSSWSGKKTK